jgi:hypothetical protein
VKLFLARPGRLTGIVVDEVTGKPIANLNLGAVKPERPAGWPAAGSATTDSKGEFTIADLPPGEYDVEITPQINPDQRVLTRFTEKDAQTVEQDFERTYWPGGHGKDTAMPVKLASGASVRGTLTGAKGAVLPRPCSHPALGVQGWGQDAGDGIHRIDGSPPRSNATVR